MKIAIILGTRPEIIKMSPVIRECEKRGLEYYILHTGQHYSFEMDRIFFDQLQLPAAKYNLDVGSGYHGAQTGQMLAGIEQVLFQDTPDVVLVQGDTNTVLAGALAAAKLHIKVGHVEAGLRSFDRTMPEEINRIMADHISDYLFAPTTTSQQHLLAEGIPLEKIFVTGNTVVDAVYQNLMISGKTTNLLKDMGLQEKGYFLATVHRAENTDNKTRLSVILDGFSQVCDEFRLSVIFPAHPHTVRMIHAFGLQIPEGVHIIDPAGYLDFLQLESSARLIITDSGGLQEEACILGVPCVTLRDNTERPETVDMGANVIAGTHVVAGVRQMLQAGNSWQHPYGKGDAGKVMINILMADL